MRRSNPHMHLLEAFLAWHRRRATAPICAARRASSTCSAAISSTRKAGRWANISMMNGSRRAARKACWSEPGHHFEWASLLVDFAGRSGQKELVGFARKLYASADRQRPQPRHRPRLWRRLPAGPAARPCVTQLAAGRGDQGGDCARRLGRARPQAGDRGARRAAVPLAHRPGAARPVDRPVSTSAAARWRPKCRPASSITWSAR